MILIKLALCDITFECTILFLGDISGQENKQNAVPFKCNIPIPLHERQCVTVQRPLGCLMKRLFGIKRNHQRFALLVHCLYPPVTVVFPYTLPVLCEAFLCHYVIELNVALIHTMHIYVDIKMKEAHILLTIYEQGSFSLWLSETRVNAVVVRLWTAID